MNLIRKIKIDKITPILTEREKEVIEYVDSWFKELRLFHIKSNTIHLYFTKKSVYVIGFNDDGESLVRDEIINTLQTITTYQDAEEYLKHVFEKKTGLGRLKNIFPIREDEYKKQEKQYKEYKLKNLLRR